MSINTRTQKLTGNIRDLITTEKLPNNFFIEVSHYLQPLAKRIADQQQGLGRTYCVGINGAQGSGKSTLSKFLTLLLNKTFDKHCVTLSIDDIYLGLSSRKDLAHSQHPLLQTRGVPGTHDIPLGLSTLNALINASPTDCVALPQFDKAQDDRIPEDQWPIHTGKVDIILLEGWCVGAQAQTPSALKKPMNKLEQTEDIDGHWRQYVNQCLATDYQQLFSYIEQLIMLKVPSMRTVYEWRGLQEKKLIDASGDKGNQCMNAFELNRFIQHFERLTQHMLLEIPSRADCVFNLSPHHNIQSVCYPQH